MGIGNEEVNKSILVLNQRDRRGDKVCALYAVNIRSVLHIMSTARNIP